jgi:hypothetical protein
MSGLTRIQSLVPVTWLALNPFAYFLVGGFSETLFIALECVVIVFLLRRQYLLAAIAVSLLTATRFSGALAFFWIVALVLADRTMSRRRQATTLVAAAALGSLGLITDIAIKWQATGYPFAAFEVRAAWHPSRFAPLSLLLHPYDLFRGDYVLSLLPLIVAGCYGLFCFARALAKRVDIESSLLLGAGLSMSVLSILISGDFNAYGRYFLTFCPAIVGILRFDRNSARCLPLLAILSTSGAAFMVFNVMRIWMDLAPN